MLTWRNAGTGRSPAGAFGLASDRLEQHVDADDAGAEERLRVEDAAVDVRLGGDVDHGVRVGDERLDDVRVGDVALDEARVARPAPASASTAARLARLPA